MLAYASTIFLAAFLLFQVQPLIGKYILPWFGGTPAVWTTCMLFFQVVLLGGYAYAHLVATKLAPRRQAVVHLAVLVAALVLLPITPSARWKPPGPEDPTWRILVLLAACVGLPYFVVATTSPLLQAWFSRARPGASPYRLYALSNAGSLLALLTYPFVVEPLLSSRTQAVVWSLGFGAFVLLCGGCAVRVWRAARTGCGLAPSGAASAADELGERPRWGRRLLWLALPACGSVMLLAVTNQMCQNVAVVPFLWVLPLSLYLLSFVICFDNERWYIRPIFWIWLAASTWHMVGLMRAGLHARIPEQVVGYSLGLLGCCMVCHGELARLKPRPRYLTSFYLSVSAGGALGGVFVSLVAPRIFVAYLELHYGLWACCALAMVAFWVDKKPHRHWPRSWVTRIGVPAVLISPFAVVVLKPFAALRWVEAPVSRQVVFGTWGLGMALLVARQVFRKPSVRWRWSWLWMGFLPTFVVALVLLGAELKAQADAVWRDVAATSRNFYGVLRVTVRPREGSRGPIRELLHGRIFHGSQLLSEEGRRQPTLYYADDTGVGLALRHHPRREAGLRVGVLGLGVGTLAAYGRRGDSFRFYEINPEAERFATSLFTYIADARERGADVELVSGDARLSLEREPPQGFDVLVVDVFTGDAIPVHLLTREAFGVYLRHLRRDGIVALNISNRYLDLSPVVYALADHFQLKSLQFDVPGDPKRVTSRSDWILVTNNPAFLRSKALAEAKGRVDDANPRRVLWTDDRSDLFRMLRTLR